ncbi:putative nitrilase [Rhodotorula toruloides]|nr:putative nitrilase [Rhodotorula toruloides]
MDTSEGVPNALTEIESQELEEQNPTFRSVTEGIAEVARRLEDNAKRLKDHAEQLDQLKESIARQEAQLDRMQAEKDRTRFLDACMISMLGVLLEQALKYTGKKVFDMPASEVKSLLFDDLYHSAQLCPSWRRLPDYLRYPWKQAKLAHFPPAFFQALRDDDIEFRPAYRIVEGAKAVKHLRTKEAHGRSFRTTCLEVLVNVGKVGTRRANGILANVPIGRREIAHEQDCRRAPQAAGQSPLSRPGLYFVVVKTPRRALHLDSFRRHRARLRRFSASPLPPSLPFSSSSARAPAIRIDFKPSPPLETVPAEVVDPFIIPRRRLPFDASSRSPEQLPCSATDRQLPHKMPRVALVQFAPLSPSSSDLPTSASQKNSDDDDNPATLSSQYNLQRAHDYVRQAARQGAELVCFPEYFLSGVVSSPSHWHLAQVPHHQHPPLSSVPSSTSHTEAEHWLQSFRTLARELKVDIAVGTIVERAVDEKTGEELSKEVEVEDDETGEKKKERRPILENVAYYVDWNGEVLGRYTKRNLWWPEKEYLCEGSEDHQIFDTRFGKVGMLICWDLAWPSAFRRLLLLGAEMIIAPTYWTATDAGEVGLRHNPHSEREYLECLVKTRAWENECALLFTNVAAPASWSPGDPIGNEEGRIGCSQVCLPFKGAIAHAKGPQEEVVFADFDLSILEDARQVYGVRRDLITKLKEKGELPDWVIE